MFLFHLSHRLYLYSSVQIEEAKAQLTYSSVTRLKLHPFIIRYLFAFRYIRFIHLFVSPSLRRRASQRIFMVHSTPIFLHRNIFL